MISDVASHTGLLGRGFLEFILHYENISYSKSILYKPSQIKMLFTNYIKLQ